MQNLLKNVEHICLDHCEMDGNVFKQLAIYCRKLKQMENIWCKTPNDGLFLQHFPTLERLKLRSNESIRVNQLKIFLEKHTNLKEIDINWEFLWANGEVLMQTNCQLDLLKVHFDTKDNISLFEQFIELLKTLHEHRFYKSLHFSFSFDVDKEHLSHAICTLPPFKRLSVKNSLCLEFNHLTNLKELNIASFNSNTNIEAIARNLPNLEQLTLDGAEIKWILPFIRHSKRLKTIQIDMLGSEVIDLFALNEERKMLENACQVSIYVPDDVYVPTKWKSHNFNLELNLIRILRIESFDFREMY